MAETFECTKCGKCCIASGNRVLLVVSEDEAAAMAMCLNMPPEQFVDMFLDDTRMKLCADGSCPMLDTETNLCRVYEARPEQCRTFPYWPHNFYGGKFKTGVRGLCEGITDTE